MISLIGVQRHYAGNGRAVRAVDGVSLEIGQHEFVALTGPSGCGKSTLMHLIAGLDQPTAGQVIVDGLALQKTNDKALTDFRRRRLGIVFQFFNLLPTMSVLENVMFPLLLQKVPPAESETRAREILGTVGLSERADHFVHQLSGGEQQRTAIARALVHRPSLFIADEPTGNLDSAATASVLAAIQQVAANKTTTVLIVTHSEEIARLATRRLAMRDGQIVSDNTL